MDAADWRGAGHAPPASRGNSTRSSATSRCRARRRSEWKGADGATIEGVLFYPVDYQSGRRYPLVVQLHGGPMESDKFGFGAGSTLHYVPVLTGKGYAVLRPNYRGSIGYGAAFVRDVVGGYFNNMRLDVLLGVDALIARGIADPDRLVADGLERRRHLVNKLVTHDRSVQGGFVGRRRRRLDFAVRRRPTHVFRRTWFGGTPWRKDAPIDLFWNNSPIKDVANVKTPTLFFVGENDTRVPLAQSVEMYRALKSLQRADRSCWSRRDEGHQWGALRAPAAQGEHRAGVVREVRERRRAYVWEKAPRPSTSKLSRCLSSLTLREIFTK